MKDQEDFISLLLLSIKSLQSSLYSLLLVSPLSSLLAIIVVVTRCWPPFGPFQAGLIVVFDSISVSVVPVLALPVIIVPIVVIPVVDAPVAVVVMMMSASFVGCTKPG